MSRTKKGKKGPGFDYGGRRPGNQGYCNCPGSGVKARTHRLERLRDKQIANQELASSAPSTEKDPACT